jgi:hypothetical protein
MLLERPPVDWKRPVQWMNGDPCTAERVSGFILITLDERYPKEIEEIMAQKHFKDSLVVHEDTGVPVTTLAQYAPDAWVENIERAELRPWEEHVGTF